jgi:glycosyltransferase involved in cell wall biosynthesis
MTFGDLPGRLSFQAKSLLFPFYVAKRMRAGKLDVIDCAIGDGWVLGTTRRGAAAPSRALLACRSHGLSLIAHRHNQDEVRRGNLKLSWKYPLYWGGVRLREEAAALKSAELVLLLNAEERQVAIEEVGLDAGRVRVVDNGLPEEFIGLPLAELDPGARFQIAHIGSYLPHKGVHYSAAALSTILLRHANVSVTYFGTGEESDRVREAFPPDLQSRISIVPSFPHGELPRLLEGFSAVLAGSLREAFMLSTLEAMAAGLVPVVTDIPGPTSYVRDGENGLIAPAADSAALAQAVERLLAEPELFATLRRGAWATAQEYAWDRIARDTLGYYEEALAHRAPSAAP